jgi:hypothetical protein
LDNPPADPDRYAFEQFPHGTLAFHLPRRKFLTALAAEFLVSARRREGEQVFALADLGNWTNEQLAGIVPVISQDCEIAVMEGCVWGRPPGRQQPVQLFPLAAPILAVFNRLNGQTSLEANARSLEQETGWNAERSFAYVRGLFLWLVLARVCLPKGLGPEGAGL